MSFGRLLDHPFREAQAVAGAALYPVSLDGHGYLIDRKAGTFVRHQVPLLKTQPADPTNPTWNLLITPEVWRRSNESWHQGAGQRWGDRQDSLPYRFDDSMGIDVWSHWQMGLLPATTQIMTTAAPLILLEVLNGALVVAEGTNLWWRTTLTGTPTLQALPSAAVSITSDGDGVILALASGTVVKARSATVPLITLSHVDGVNFVHYVKDRLLAAAANVLWDITSITDGSAPVSPPVSGSGLPDPKIYQHPLAAFRWVSATDGLSCIYALGGVGDRWVIHRIDLLPDATVAPPIVAAPLQDGEVGYGIGSYMGYVFVGSQHGVRFGIPETTGDLTLGPLIPTKGPVRCFEGQERFVWYGNPNPDSTHTGLGRLDLVTFTLPLTPAYANDLMAPAPYMSGPVPPPGLAMQGDVTGVVTAFGDKRVFAVAAQGVFIEDTALVPTGWLTEGSYSFNVVDKKIGLYAQVRFAVPLVGKVAVEFQYDDPLVWEPIVVFDSELFSTTENIFLDGAIFIRMRPRFTLYSNAGHTDGPEISRWEIRAVPQAGKASEWIVPLVIHDVLTMSSAVVARDVQADLDRLLGLVETSRIFTYREGPRSWLVNALDFEWRPQMLSERIAAAWQGVFTIRIRETR